jgi:AcrR family transcriptional regulator
MAGKLEAKKEKRRMQIVNETIRQIRSSGYDKTTMEGIAKSCQITKRTLYKYYPVKEAILADFVGMTFSQKEEDRLALLKNVSGLYEKIHLYLIDLMEGVMREPVIFEHYIAYVMRNLVVPQVAGQETSGVASPLHQILLSGLETGEIDPVMPMELVVDFFLFVFVEMTKFYYKNPVTFHIQESAHQSAKLFVQGVKRKESPCKA